MAVAVSLMIVTPRPRSASYDSVRLSMVRWPLSTRLLNGQEMNSRPGSIITTSIEGSAMRTYRAAAAPPQPPPMTTTRRPLLDARSPVVPAQPLQPKPAPAASPTPMPEERRKSLRVCPPMGRLLGCSGPQRLPDAGEHQRLVAFEMHRSGQSRRRVLDPGAGEHDDHARAGVHVAGLFHLRQRGQRGGGLGRGPDALD